MPVKKIKNKIVTNVTNNYYRIGDYRSTDFKGLFDQNILDEILDNEGITLMYNNKAILECCITEFENCCGAQILSDFHSIDEQKHKLHLFLDALISLFHNEDRNNMTFMAIVTDKQSIKESFVKCKYFTLVKRYQNGKNGNWLNLFVSNNG